MALDLARPARSLLAGRAAALRRLPRAGAVGRGGVPCLRGGVVPLGACCRRCGAPLPCAVDACAECRGRALAFDRAWAAFAYDGAARRSCWRSRRGGRTACAALMARGDRAARAPGGCCAARWCPCRRIRAGMRRARVQPGGALAGRARARHRAAGARPARCAGPAARRRSASSASAPARTRGARSRRVPACAPGDPGGRWSTTSTRPARRSTPAPRRCGQPARPGDGGQLRPHDRARDARCGAELGGGVACEEHLHSRYGRTEVRPSEDRDQRTQHRRHRRAPAARRGALHDGRKQVSELAPARGRAAGREATPRSPTARSPRRRST